MKTTTQNKHQVEKKTNLLSVIVNAIDDWLKSYESKMKLNNGHSNPWTTSRVRI
jgi:hypothetical protein